MAKNCKNECVKKASIGGQALIEGIMMRGPKMTAMAVRDTNGDLVLEKWKTDAAPKSKLFKLPVIRGVYGFVSSLLSGYKCLMRSAELSGLEEAEEELRREKEAKKAKKAEKKARGKVADALTENVSASETADTAPDKIETEKSEITESDAAKDTNKTNKKKDKKDSGLSTAVMLIASVLGVAVSVFLFIALPTFIYKWCFPLFPETITGNDILNSFFKSAFEGVLRIIVLVAYMLLVSLMKDIRRTFMYHGAEHKTIFCYEHGKELTVENVRREGRFHPRCGTSFLILMLIVGIFVSFFIDPVFLLITKDPELLKTTTYTILRVGVKILLTPLIMGIGYELIKFAGKHDNIVTKVISAPGVWLQHVTVLEPDDGMIECAIKAFVEVLPDEEKPKVAPAAETETVSEESTDAPTENDAVEGAVASSEADAVESTDAE